MAQERAFDFYTLEGATALAKALATWDGGRLVINVVDMPIKCPVAPLEFAFLADWYFTKRGMRDKVSITYATPLDGAFTKPKAAGALSYLLESKGIELVTEFNAGEVDGEQGRLVSWDEREVPFDLLVSVPLHMGSAFVGRSPGLGDDLDFVLTDPTTLQAIGQEERLRAGRCLQRAHLQGGLGGPLPGRGPGAERPGLSRGSTAGTRASDGHANCFIETGLGKALLIDFNYDVEPLPGRFPLPMIGPLPLLKESRLNHWGKLAFRWIYWNMLLPGRNLPLVTPNLDMRGKNLPAGPSDQAA